MNLQRVVYLREQRHVGALSCRGVGQGEGEAALVGPPCHRQAGLSVKQLLSWVHSVGSWPRQSLRHTERINNSWKKGISTAASWRPENWDVYMVFPHGCKLRNYMHIYHRQTITHFISTQQLQSPPEYFQILEKTPNYKSLHERNKGCTCVDSQAEGGRGPAALCAPGGPWGWSEA